ncbi:MAG: hypothetical protein PHI83_05220 [Sphaerochaetaceae bacterium]|jgi:hypothetical protein|nr:hypothetical protein [Sphaerochaetaceae bacterium]
MKKLLAALLLAAILPAVAFAGLIDVGFGTNISTVQTVSETFEGFDAVKLGFGPEARLKIFFIELNAKAVLNANQEDVLMLHGTVGASLCLEAGPFRIGVGAQSEGIVFGSMNGELIGPNFISSQDFERSIFENFNDTYLYLRANADIKLGRLLLGVDYIVPTDFLFGAAEKDFSLLLPQDWAAGKLSISLLYCLF